MKKNLSIEFMRYLMIIAIAILHFGEEFPNPFPTLWGVLFSSSLEASILRNTINSHASLSI